MRGLWWFIWSADGAVVGGILALLALVCYGAYCSHMQAQQTRQEWEEKKSKLEAYVQEHPEAWPFYKMVLEAEKKTGDVTVIPVFIPR